MKFVVSLLLTAITALACGFYLPWWSVAVASFVVSLAIHQRPLIAFLAGFGGVFLLWLVLSVIINSSNNGVLAPKVSALIGLGGSVVLLMVVSCIAGSLVGGLGALTGSLVRRAIT